MEAKVDEDLKARALLAGALSAALEVMDTSQQLVVSSTVENLPNSLASQKEVNQSFRALAEEILRSEASRFGKKEEAFTRHSEEHWKNMCVAYISSIWKDMVMIDLTLHRVASRPLAKPWEETIASSRNPRSSTQHIRSQNFMQLH